jgi:hypothetical protein
VSSRRARQLGAGAARGVVAGLAGVAVMTAAEKAEQVLTGRANSYVPARALLILLRPSPREDARPVGWNHAMHWGTGALLGALRGTWSVTGIRAARQHSRTPSCDSRSTRPSRTSQARGHLPPRGRVPNTSSTSPTKLSTPQ